MSLIKSRKPIEFTVKVPQSLFDEIYRYSDWASVSIDDIITQSVEMLFERDQKWIDENAVQSSGTPLNKTKFVRQVYAEIVSGKYPTINDEAGKVSAGSVYKVINDDYKRTDIAYGTCTAQTSYCNSLIRNENNARERSESTKIDWEFLREKIESLGGKV